MTHKQKNFRPARQFTDDVTGALSTEKVKAEIERQLSIGNPDIVAHFVLSRTTNSAYVTFISSNSQVSFRLSDHEDNAGYVKDGKTRHCVPSIIIGKNLKKSRLEDIVNAKIKELRIISVRSTIEGVDRRAKIFKMQFDKTKQNKERR